MGKQDILYFITGFIDGFADSELKCAKCNSQRKI